MTGHQGSEPPPPRERYRGAVLDLAAPLRHRIAAGDRADHALVLERRRINARTQESAAWVAEADTAVAAAAGVVEETDAECSRLWRELRDFQGRRDIGALPPPGPPGGESAPVLLGRAEGIFARARRGELRIPMPVPIMVAMLVAGLTGALVLFGAGEALLVAARGMAGNERAAARIAAEIAFFAAPVAGIPLGMMWLARYGQPMPARALVVLVGTGLVVGCGLFGLLVR